MEAVQNALGNFQTREAAELVLEIADVLGDWGGRSFVVPLGFITGIQIGGYKTPMDSVLGAYRQLLDSIPSMAELRELGYQRSSELRESDFANRSDYLVHLIRHNRQEWWLHGHAIRELIARRDPVVLRELAGARYRLVGFSRRRGEVGPEAWLHKLTNTAVEVTDEDGGIAYMPFGRKVDSDQFLAYWANNYQRYKWSEEEERFHYQGRSVVLVEDPVARYFNDLFAADDETVYADFQALTEFEPEAIRLRAKPYHLNVADNITTPRPVSSTHTLQLGDHLALMAELTAFCRLRSLPVSGPERLVAWLSEIDRAGKEDAQLDKVRELKALLTANNLTGLELYTIVNHMRYPRASKAIGAMLAERYADWWPRIVADPVALRVYLKKCSVYPRAGARRGWAGFGVPWAQLSDEAFAALKEVVRSETDEDILAIARRAVISEEVRRKDRFTVREYLDYTGRGEMVAPERVRIDTSASGLGNLFDQLNKGDEAQVQATVALIGYHLSERMAPYLLASAGSKQLYRKGFVSWRDVEEGRQTIRYNIVVGDLMVSFLERLYKHQIPVTRDRPWSRAMVSSSGGLTEYWGKHGTADAWRAWVRERE